MIRPLGAEHAVARGRAALGLHLLLQLALGVATHGAALGQATQRIAHDEAADLARAVDSSGHVDRADDGLDRVGEHVVAVALAGRVSAAAELQRGREADRSGPRRERLGVDEERSHQRELALVGRGEPLHQQLARDEAEHRVAEELQALVVDAPVGPLLVGEARVSQGLFEQGAAFGEAYVLEQSFGEHRSKESS